MQELDYKAIGNRIKEQREYLGYTRQQFAEALQKSINYCRNIETGDSGMSMQTLIDVSRVLKISTDYILTGEDKSENDRLYRTLSSCTGRQREALDSIVSEVIRTYDRK